MAIIVLFMFINLTPNPRSLSNSPEVDGAPPASRRRAKSPASNPDSDSDGPSPPKDGKLEARVAAMELDVAEKEKANAAEKVKEKESAQRAEFAKLLNTRSGGTYIPPARLRAMQEAASSDKSSAEYQRLSWDALRKSITGIVNRVNIANIKMIVPELFAENLIRGRGLFARSVMKAQASSLPFTPVFAALVSIINTKLPQVGELVLTRLISQFRRSFKRNDKVYKSLLFVQFYLISSNRSSVTRRRHSLRISSTNPLHTKSLPSKSWSFSLNAQQTTPSKSLLVSLAKSAPLSQKTHPKPMLRSLNASVPYSTKDASANVCNI